MKSKNKIMKAGIAVAAVVALGMTVQATPINGAIAFSDFYTANGPLNSATAINSFSSVTVSAAVGDYSALIPGTIVDFSTVTAAHPFTFNPSTSYAGLWSIGGGTYTFDITSSTILSQTSSTLSLEGTGVAHITGYDATAGTWNLTLNSNGGILNFSGGAAVPDGGVTAMLLGAALSALGLFRKKLMA